MVNKPSNSVDTQNLGFEGKPIQPNKVTMTTHPSVCDCKKCNMEYCDCSEEQQGTVAHSEEYWQTKV